MSTDTTSGAEQLHCLQLSNHSQLGTTGSCLCGLRKYKEDPIVGFLTNQVGCGFCKKPPMITDIQKRTVCCATEGCPAHLTEVSWEKWCERGKHELEVLYIPEDEPIFILRGQDLLSLVAIYTWIDTAEKKKVPDEKTDAAVKHADEIQAFQRGNPERCKMPD